MPLVSRAIIATNTTLASQRSAWPAQGKEAWAGVRPAFVRKIDAGAGASGRVDPHCTIIGSAGVGSAQQGLWTNFRRSPVRCSFIPAAWFYGGIRFAEDIAKGLDALLERGRAFTNVADAVGYRGAATGLNTATAAFARSDLVRQNEQPITAAGRQKGIKTFCGPGALRTYRTLCAIAIGKPWRIDTSNAAVAQIWATSSR